MKESYYCKKLEGTLHFLPDKIKFCCSCAEGPGIVIEDTSAINKQEIIDTKNKFIKMLKNGIIPKECTGCVEFSKKEAENFFKELFSKKEDKKIKHIIIDHYKQCDCACIYCSQKVLYPNTVQNYEILPLIKQMYTADMIDDDVTVEFQGGNISMLKEFDALIDKFEKHNCKHYKILTNGIKYLPTLERIAKKTDCEISVSLDSGTKETFEKIKKVDAFEQTIQNIKNLMKFSKAHIKLKYIIVEGINDNIDEIKSFLEIAKTVDKLDSIILEIDYRDILLNRKKSYKVPSHYFELFNFTEKYCKENYMPFFVLDFVKSFLK